MSENKLNYTKEELDDIMHKEVEIMLGEINDDDNFTYKGKIISYKMAVNDPNRPADFCFHTIHQLY